MVLKYDQRKLAWFRFVTVLITVLLFCLVLRGVDFKALNATFSRIHSRWLILAAGSYGLLFVPSAWRWRLVLKLASKAVKFGTILRISLIGHFFYTILFGVIGGDSAKAVLYARRFRFAASEILATAPLDRLLGLGGSLIFSGVALALAVEGGAFTSTIPVEIKPHLGWLVIIGVAVVLVLLFVK